MHDTHPTGRTRSMSMRPDPAFVARALRWAGIDANVTPDPDDGDGVLVIDLDTGQEVTASALFSAVLLAYIDAGQPAEAIVERGR